ncbi:Metallo-dependent phosphatase-like protein [Mariannaea sp. PMI_226]|nr:Metallo-dependent phosphatase-like protein [Mariannaea sp. PMI_226]
MRRILDAALISSLLVLSHQSAIPRAASNDNLPPLTFNSDGAFQIAMFSDLHFGQDESSTGPEQDCKTEKVICQVLDYDPPDLVVFNGDLINGDTTHRDNSTLYLDKIVTPLVKRNLTWASSYGNHDHAYNLNGEDLLEREHMFTGSRTKSMVNGTTAGITNYYLPVYPSNCTASARCAPELILWFFDSRGGDYYQGDTQPDWVDKSVVEWFNETNNALVEEYKKVIPSLAFVHIPINATWSLRNKDGVDPNRQPGIDEEEPVPQGSSGMCFNDPDETCGYEEKNDSFMQALVSVRGIIGLFSGHDHGNTWCYKWDSQVEGMTTKGNGINLCYNQHGGYGGYGDWIRGAREIVVTQSQLANYTVDTHIRLESGDVVGAVSLNATFNEDLYPSTFNSLTFINQALVASSASSPSRTDPLLSSYVAATAYFGFWAFVLLSFS